jgi:hypothetical protein
MKNVFIIIGIIVVIGVSIFFLLINNETDTSTSTTTNEKSLLNIDSKMTTAKQAYSIALSEAKKFSSDSYLVDFNTVGIQNDGTSQSWFITFYSPSKQTNYKVNIIEGKVEQASEKNLKKTVEITGDWINSNQLAQIAIPKCDTVTENKFFLI